MNKAPYLGKVVLYWCDDCNVPLIDNIKCANCGGKNSRSRKVQITPPGDIRPAFDDDYTVIWETINREFGEGIGLGERIFPSDKIVLLNSVGGLDRVDEIVMDGIHLGQLIYDIVKEKYVIHPTIILGNHILFWQKQLNLSKKRIIEISEDGYPFVVQGKSILVPSIKTIIDKNIQKDDYILGVYKGQCICVAKSLESSISMEKIIKESYGQLAKNIKYWKKLATYEKTYIDSIWNNSFNYSDSDVNLKDLTDKNNLHNQIIQNLLVAYRANQIYIKTQEKKAHKFILDTKEKYHLPPVVAYSGGKDSLATLILVDGVLKGEYQVFFSDTGIELPEVIQNITDIVKYFDVEDKTHIMYAGDIIWDLSKRFGPPARDYRFCCHSLKAQNINAIIKKLYDGKRVLSYLGQRQYESLSRSKNPMVYTNSFIPLQLAATPIKKWNALLLWLYILFEQKDNLAVPRDVPVNPLYFDGHVRLGCYLCPASNLATFKKLETTHPKLMDKWNNFLYEYAKEYNYPKEWVTYGLWRYKRFAPQWEEFIEEQKIEINPTVKMSNEFEIGYLESFDPLNPDESKNTLKIGYNGKISQGIIDFLEIKKYLPSFARKDTWNFNEEMNILRIKSRYKKYEYTIIFYLDGEFEFEIDSNIPRHKISRLIETFLTVILKSIRCTDCKTCQTVCKISAINFDEDGIHIDIDKCVACHECITHCPLNIDLQKFIAPHIDNL